MPGHLFVAARFQADCPSLRVAADQEIQNVDCLGISLSGAFQQFLEAVEMRGRAHPFIAFRNVLREMPPQVLEGNAELLCRRLDRRAGGEDVVQPSTIRVLAHTALKRSATSGRPLRAVRWW